MHGLCNVVKILNIQPFDYSGSIERRSLQVALELRKEGIETIFVNPREEYSFTKMAFENGFKVYKTSCLRPVFVNNKQSLTHVVNWIKGIPRNIVEMYKITRFEQPHVLQVNGFVCIQEALVAAFCYRRRFLWNLIGTTIYPRFIIAMFLPVIRLASARIFVAKKLVNYFFCNYDYWIINEPVDTDEFNPNKIDISKLNSLRKSLTIEKDAPIIGFLAFISPQKGLEYLLRGIRLVKKKYNNVKLIVVGDAPPHQAEYYMKLKYLVSELELSENVLFLGYVKRKEIPLLLSAFDIFVSASIYEGTPVTILEAMSMGIPVVATDVGGVSEQVLNGETGILITPKNPNAIAEAIIFLLQNKDKRIEMGKKARRRIQKVFSLQKCVLQYRKLYLSMTSG